MIKLSFQLKKKRVTDEWLLKDFFFQSISKFSLACSPHVIKQSSRDEEHRTEFPLLDKVFFMHTVFFLCFLGVFLCVLDNMMDQFGLDSSTECSRHLLMLLLLSQLTERHFTWKAGSENWTGERWSRELI